MSSTETATDRRRQRRRRRRPGGSETTTDGSLCFSDSEEQSTAGGSYEECRFSEIEGSSSCPNSSSRRECCSMSEEEEEEVDLESGDLELKVHKEEERDCRICHLSMVVDGGGVEEEEELGGGVWIELGCDCKGDLGAAHKHCADTWFKIRGNSTCEICGATAHNVAGESANEANDVNGLQIITMEPMVPSETRSVWHGRRIMNILLACMVLAFVISWLFHFDVLP
ncbi:hypothetical protein LguiB_000747 [Lonicera macranthoides]